VNLSYSQFSFISDLPDKLDACEDPDEIAQKFFLLEELVVTYTMSQEWLALSSQDQTNIYDIILKVCDESMMWFEKLTNGHITYYVSLSLSYFVHKFDYQGFNERALSLMY
jgi:hypothetical protein